MRHKQSDADLDVIPRHVSLQHRTATNPQECIISTTRNDRRYRVELAHVAAGD